MLGSSIQYSSRTGNHIVREILDYFPREQEALDIVKHMRARKRARKIKLDDKTANPLIAIPGSPGI